MGVFDNAVALITQPNRRYFGTIIPDIVIEEISNDATQISQYPVETGAAIADHAYVQPAALIMRCGFSNSSHQNNLFVQEVYAQILALRNTLAPMNVSTGKRLYTNLLISSLAVTTDQESENALMIVVSFREVLLTSTSGGSGQAPDTSAAADQSQTGAVSSYGVSTAGDAGAGVAPLTNSSGNAVVGGTFGLGGVAPVYSSPATVS